MNIKKTLVKYDRAFFWFRRDLRLHDNHALTQALALSKNVIPIFILDTKILKTIDKKSTRLALLMHALENLKSELQKKKSDLFIFRGDPVSLIPRLCKLHKAETIFFNKDYEPDARKRDGSIKEKLRKQNIEVFDFKDHVIFEENEILKDDHSPYKVFTPYKKRWLERLESNPFVIGEFKANFKNLATEKIKTSIKLPYPIFSGEREALKVFKKFQKIIDRYHLDRDYPAKEGTSMLSSHLRFGTISTRELVRFVFQNKSAGANTWLSELIWREFYQMILWHFPHVVGHAFNEKYEHLRWPGKKEHLQAWKEGRTGFPIIDASMRALNETGFMHNRLRMITASFLVKTLLIDWKEGEKYFAEKLLDYDLAANNGGWQWCASTGTDAQPYFRIFNPLLQSLKFDPDATFIKKYCPELRDLPLQKIHAPWTATLAEQKKAACLLGKNYPWPIVNYAENREKAIALYSNSD